VQRSECAAHFSVRVARSAPPKNFGEFGGSGAPASIIGD